MTTPATITALLLFVPLLPVALIPLLPYWHRASAVAPWVPAAALALLPLTGSVAELPWLLLGARVGLDATARPLLLLAALAWTLAGWHARATIPAAQQPRFFVFWLATWCGNLCVLITLDAASFYAAYAMMTFSAWGLIVHNGGPEDRRAGRVYIALALVGEALLIAGLLMAGASAGNFALDNAGATIAGLDAARAVTALLLAGFAVKAGLVPLHVWLPLAHPRAPVPASAVLSGVMLTAGLAGWLRFLPLGHAGFGAAGSTLIAAGLTSAFYGALVGLGQARPKTVLAYSSVSQMGLVATAVGIALVSPAAAPALMTVAVLFAVHHGLAKAALFLGVDLARDVPGLARALLWIPAASIAGLPLTSGSLAKTALKDALPYALAGWLKPLLFATSVATTLVLARFLVVVWPHQRATGGVQRALAWLALALAAVVVPWPLFAAAEPAWIGHAFATAGVVDAALPVLIGALLSAAALRFAPTAPSLPEGDLAALWPRHPRGPTLPQWPRPTWRPRAPVLDALERALARVGTAVVVWLVIVAALFLASR